MCVALIIKRINIINNKINPHPHPPPLPVSTPSLPLLCFCLPGLFAYFRVFSRYRCDLLRLVGWRVLSCQDPNWVSLDSESRVMTVAQRKQFKSEVRTLAFVAEQFPMQICVGLGLLCFPVFAGLLFCCLLAERCDWAVHSKNSNNAT